MVLSGAEDVVSDSTVNSPLRRRGTRDCSFTHSPSDALAYRQTEVEGGGFHMRVRNSL